LPSLELGPASQLPSLLPAYSPTPASHSHGLEFSLLFPWWRLAPRWRQVLSCARRSLLSHQECSLASTVHACLGSFSCYSLRRDDWADHSLSQRAGETSSRACSRYRLRSLRGGKG